MKTELIDSMWPLTTEPPPKGFYDELEEIFYEARITENARDFCYLASPLRKHFQVHQTDFNRAEVRHKGRLIAIIHN